MHFVKSQAKLRCAGCIRGCVQKIQWDVVVAAAGEVEHLKVGGVKLEFRVDPLATLIKGDGLSQFNTISGDDAVVFVQ